jgi:acetylornithine deacetylase
MGAKIEANKLNQPYFIVITADEENGMLGAMKVAAESRTLKRGWPRNGVVAEPISLRPIYAHKGAVRMYITAHGRSAHTSTDKGLSANFLIAPFLADMAILFETFKTDESYLDANFQPPTNGFNMVIDDGGCNPNVTPAKTVCTISLRTMPDGNSNEAVNMVLEAVKKHGLECQHFVVDPFYVSEDSEILQAAFDITGCTKGETAPYGTEALFYQDYVDLVILGPGYINQAHTIEEWVKR